MPPYLVTLWFSCVTAKTPENIRKTKLCQNMVFNENGDFIGSKNVRELNSMFYFDVNAASKDGAVNYRNIGSIFQTCCAT